MKNLKKIIALLLVAAMVIALAACGGSSNSGSSGSSNTAATDEKEAEEEGEAEAEGEAEETTAVADPVKWDFCVINSLTHPSSVLCQQFADEVNEATNGLVEITVRAPGELSYSANDYLTAVGDGSIQLSDVGSNCYGVLKVGAMSVLPFLADNLDDMDKVMDIIEPYLNEELADFGAKYLFYYVWPAQSLWTSDKELTSITDISGMKIRTSNNELSELVKRWGGTPTSLTGAEVPAGLQTGVVDGVITSAYGLGGAGWDDSLNYGLITNCQIIPDYICVNADEFNALPQDAQDAIMELADKYQKLMCESMFNDELEWRETLKDGGMVINEASAEEIDAQKAEIQTYWDEWAQDRGGNCADVLAEIREALGL